MAMKKILAVAVGAGQWTPGVTQQQLATLRAILQRLVATLASKHGQVLNTDYAMDYLQVMPGPTMQQRIETGIKDAAPDLVLTITTAPTVAARDARQALNKGDLPIVFAVVSHPESPEYGSLVDPKTMRGQQITGVSTSLVQNVKTFRDILKNFRDADGLAVEAHSISDPGYVSSKRARKSLTQGVVWHDLPGDDETAIIRTIQGLPRVTPKERRVCLLVTPSNVMYAFRKTVIGTAQGDKGIPTFFQQLECVDPGTANVQDSAVAAFGLSPETIGDEAAKTVAAVLQDPGAASTIPVAQPKNFEIRVNRDVAKALRLDLVQAGAPKAAAKAARPAMVAKAAKRPAAKPKQKAKVAGRKPKAAKRAAPRPKGRGARRARPKSGRGKKK